MHKIKYSLPDWIFLLPLVAACIVAFLRFPLLMGDDHLKVVDFIAREHRWPPVPLYDRNDQAQHTLLHHTIAAFVYRGLMALGTSAPLSPGRGVQLLSVLWALGIIPFVWLVLRRMIKDYFARVFAFLIFGTFTSWVSSSVTIDNDMAMSFWGSLALWGMVVMMQKATLPSYRAIACMGIAVGIAALMKATASLMGPVVILSLMSRKWFFRERFKPLLIRATVFALIWISLASHNYFRYYRDTGYFIHHETIQRPTPSIHRYRWDYLSFRFIDILKGPFKVTSPDVGELLTPADKSFWSKLYLTWWRLPRFLPDAPNPWATSGLYIVALPVTLIGVFGFLLGFIRMENDPAWFPILGWWLIGLIAILIGSWYIPDVQVGSFINPRFIYFSSASQIVFFAYGFQRIIERWPSARFAIAILVVAQVVIFWWLLLDGPFYSFWEPWPDMRCP